MSNDFGQQLFQKQQFKHKPSDIVKPVDHESIRSSLRLPARGLLAAGILSLIISVTAMIGGVIYCASNKIEMQRYWVIQLFGEEIKLSSSGRGDNKKLVELKGRRDSQAQTAFTMVLGAITIGGVILSSVYMLFISGGVMMMQLRNHKMCKMACIIALIPGLSPLLVVGIPFGILGLRQLSRRDVKKAFI